MPFTPSAGAPCGAAHGKTELLNVLGEVKARVQDKLGIDGFPMPQFIIVGRQSVGKSRLIEALAGETFNFVSGSLGSRRPTVLEFRNSAALSESKWHMRDRSTKQWATMSRRHVMEEVVRAHEELGLSVSDEAIYLRVESPHCVDVQIVDLPGFRDFAADDGKRELKEAIESMVDAFMRVKTNVMLCVEQAGDSSTLSTLQRCRGVDPHFERTILIRSKLDKQHGDLTSSNADRWVEGFGDLPADMERPARFALTLPFWSEDEDAPKDFVRMREERCREDLVAMRSKGLSEKYMRYIGLNNFASYLEGKISVMFSEAIDPVLSSLTSLRSNAEEKARALSTEQSETDPEKMLSTTRECGVSFATALAKVMEGVLDTTAVRSLEDELRAFHRYHEGRGMSHFDSLPSKEFSGIDDYIGFLRDGMDIPSFDLEVSGGAQLCRLVAEVEIFMRFADLGSEASKRDVIQARGASAGSLSWRDVVLKILGGSARAPLLKSVAYAGERLKWFFEEQKSAVLEFMDALGDMPHACLHSPLYPKHARLMKQNDLIKGLVFERYDAACATQLEQFMRHFDTMLNAAVSNPFVFVRGLTTGGADTNSSDDAVLPSCDEAKDQAPKRIKTMSSVDAALSQWLAGVPSDPQQIDDAVIKVQSLVRGLFCFVRSQLCDEVEVLAESFFKLPMLRHLEGNMATIEITGSSSKLYQERREQLRAEIAEVQETLTEVVYCIQQLEGFRFRHESRM